MSTSTSQHSSLATARAQKMIVVAPTSARSHVVDEIGRHNGFNSDSLICKTASGLRWAMRIDPVALGFDGLVDSTALGTLMSLAQTGHVVYLVTDLSVATLAVLAERIDASLAAEVAFEVLGA